MADQKLRVGIVGAGGIVRSRHMPGFAAIDGVSVDAVANRTRESSERAAAEFGIPRVHEHWRALVADRELDAVVVGTWPNLHAPVTIAALAAGKHVLVQARLARDAVEGRAIAAAAAARPDLVTMVVPAPFTFWADARLRQLLADGEIGQLRLVRAFFGGGNGPLRPGPGWRRDRRYSGNNVLALGIHYEQLARWVGHAVWVQANEQIIEPYSADVPVDVPDLVSVQAELPGGARLSLDMSPHARFGGPDIVHLFGSTGTLVVNVDDRQILLRREGGVEEDVTPPAADRGEWRVEAEFVGAIRGTEQVRLTDVDTAVRYLEFTDAVRQSAAEGRRIGLPPAMSV
jgi:predicted dehydrogenase